MKQIPSIDIACSDFKALQSYNNLKTATFTDASTLQVLNLAGRQIYSSRGTYLSSPPPTCKLSDIFPPVSETFKDIKKRNIHKIENTYFGNWAVLRNAENTTDIISVLGFFDGKIRFMDPEYHVRHLNLCKFAKVTYNTKYKFVAGGMFGVGIEPNKQLFMINLDSGSMHISRSWFNMIGYTITDKEVLSFARPHVKKTLIHVLL